MSVPESDVVVAAFPKLTAEQIDLLRPYGQVHQTHAAEVLFEVGDRGYPMVVILSGSMEIIDRSERVDRVIRTSGPNEFLGELNLLTGQKAVAVRRARIAHAFLRRDATTCARRSAASAFDPATSSTSRSPSMIRQCVRPADTSSRRLATTMSSRS